MSKSLEDLPRLTPESRSQTGLFGSRLAAAPPLQAVRARPTTQRVTESPGFLLHSYPHRETSLILDVLTREHGRVALIAKGAKRPHSALRAVLASFQQLSFSWSGSQELKTLTKAEWAAPPLRIEGDKSMSGWYLNELLIRLMARDDPHPGVFDAYLEALRGLSGNGRPGHVLRRFEWALLKEMGYGFDPGCTDSGQAVEAGGVYRVSLESGPERVQPGIDDVGDAPLPGEFLLALAQEHFEAESMQALFRRFLRERLDYHMNGRTMATRQVLRELTQFLSE